MKFNERKIIFTLQSIILVMTFLLVAFYFIGCDQFTETKVVDNGSGRGGASACSNGQPNGSTRALLCPEGQAGSKIEICSSGTWVIQSNTCGAGGAGGDCASSVSFEKDIKPIITAKCLSCHTSPEPYDRYATAKSLGPEMIERINLSFANARRMPKQPLPELNGQEKQLFEKWEEGGFIQNEECPTTGATLGLDYIETSILNDLNKLDNISRQNARYLISTHKFDEGVSPEQLTQFNSGFQKALNTISQEKNIVTVGSIDPNKTVYRVDLRSFDLVQAEWDLVINADLFKFESFTTKGLLIKQLTGSARPWMHTDTFTFTSQQPAIFNQLAEIPATRDELFAKIGLNFQQDFDEFNALLAGFNGSPISLNKNRLLSRNETDDGYIWISYDPVAIAGVAERNLFEFPLLPETKGIRLFNFAASEFIFSTPNGLQAYALYNAAGARQEAAPLNIVADNESPFDPEIKNGISCHRCHSKGLIPSTDQIRNHVTQNAAQFDPADVERVRAYFRDSSVVSASFAADNRKFSQALAKLNIDINKPDPVNFLTDVLRADKTLKSVASFVFLSDDDFKRLLNGSAAAKAQIGQLLTGGTITFDQLVQTFPIMVKDFRLGQDAINQQ